MRDLIIQQLRERSFVKGKQKTWVSELSDDQIYELFLRLRKDEPAKSIARYIQKAWNVNPDSSVHSISQGVLKFKNRVAHLLLAPPSEKTLDVTPNDENDAYLDQIEGMERIAHLQLNRIRQMVAEEEETGIKQTSMSRDIHALTALIKAITKAKEWEMVHQGNDPSKERRLQRLQRKMGVQFDGLMDQLGDDGRDRMVKITRRFLELAEEHAVPAEIGPDGKLRLVKPLN